MIQKEDRQSGPAVGVDVGATLAKLATRRPGGEFSFDLLPAGALETVARGIRDLSPGSVGLTGCGAGRLEQQLDLPTRRFIEFEAWGAGAHQLLSAQPTGTREPYLLVSLGTGTSILRVAEGHALRLGGTALGGGTILGLGVALTGCKSYEELCRLAQRGKRGNVDLLVSDIYKPNEIPLPGEITAACFGNLARWLTPQSDEAGTAEAIDPSRREDLAAAVMGLVGENVALICAGLARGAETERVVYGGATLLENPTLVAILTNVTSMLGLTPVLLPQGGFTGAVGALELAANSDRAGRAPSVHLRPDG